MGEQTVSSSPIGATGGRRPASNDLAERRAVSRVACFMARCDPQRGQPSVSDIERNTEPALFKLVKLQSFTPFKDFRPSSFQNRECMEPSTKPFDLRQRLQNFGKARRGNSSGRIFQSSYRPAPSLGRLSLPIQKSRTLPRKSNHVRAGWVTQHLCTPST